MDIVDYILLPLIFLFQMAYAFKTLIVPFLVHYFHHKMFVVIGWEDYIIQRSWMIMILLTYHITNNISSSFNLYTLHDHSGHVFCGTSLAHHQRAEYLKYTLQHPHAPARLLQKDDLWPKHASRRLTCHHYDHQLSLDMHVRGDSKHRA